MTRNARPSREIYFGDDGLARLTRMTSNGRGLSEVVNEALKEKEMRDTAFRETVRAAIIRVADHPEQAVQELTDLLGSHPAAEGIVLALLELQ